MFFLLLGIDLFLTMADFTDSFNEWEYDFEENNEINQKWFIKENIVFLIDVNKQMFSSYFDNNSTFFSTAIEICKIIILNLIKRCKNDKICIILYGTNDSKTHPVVKYINILSELKKPNIELIKILDDLILINEDKYGQSPFTPLADAIWYSNYILSKSNEKQTNSSIFIITCVDKPEVGDSKKQFNLRKRIEDVIKNDFDIKLLPLGGNFNMETFYNAYNNISKPFSGFEEVEKVISEIETKMIKFRSVSSLNFIIDDNLFFSISVFNFYTRTKIPAKVKLDKKTNKHLISINRVLTENNELLYKSDLAKYCNIAHQNIIFKNQDISILKSSVMPNPCIKLLGFRNKDKILIQYHFKIGSFIQPNEKIIGSSLLFKSILESCIEKNKIIMCLIKIRKGGRVNLAALIPTTELIDENGIQIEPSGFHIYYLPFFESLRNIKQQLISDLPQITDLQVSISNLICDSMPYNYCPSKIKNPKLNSHWAILQALALEVEKPEDILDETLPLYDVIENKLRIIKDDIYEQLFPFGYNPSKTSNKRAVSSSSDDHNEVIKRFRSSPNLSNMEELAKKGLIDSLKVDELKKFLLSQGEEIFGKKVDLVDRIINIFKK